MSIVQIGYVVHNFEESCARLNALFGVGPFLGGTPFTLENHIYRGRPAAPIHLRGVFVQSGEMNIELLQVLSNGPSAFGDMFTGAEEGVHHTAQFCTDYTAERNRLVAAGFPVASAFTTAFGAEICYVDTRAALGHMIELYPEHPIIRGMYAQTRAAASAWNGAALIIPWPD
jgi:hypothetical protein